ncbi:MAG: hypothetical protein ABH849_00775 [Nanoarchaeota archaeon]
METKSLELKLAREDFNTYGAIAHFGGEFILAGSMLAFTFGAITTNNPDWSLLVSGVSSYLVLQPPAFFFKALSFNKERNEHFSKKGKDWDYKLHGHVARNQERYERFLEYYTKLKRHANPVLEFFA